MAEGVASLQAAGEPVGRIHGGAFSAAGPHFQARQMIEQITTADGLALAALPGGATDTAALAMRLRVKAHDAMGWRPHQADDPWDAGWVIDTPAARAHWPSGFMPCRATLVLADRRQADALCPHLAALAARRADLWHAVRWLWVGGESAIEAAHGLAVTRFTLV